jgi:hypothetical protein
VSFKSFVCNELLTVCSIIFGFAYWYVWTVLLPWWNNYELEEAVDIMDDGTTITKLVHVPKSTR